MPPTVTTIERLTPRGRGAVAVIAVRGPQATDHVEHYFSRSSSRNLSNQPIARIHYGRWGSAAGEEIVVCRRTETTVEVHCHGGDAASERILNDLIARGCSPAESAQNPSLEQPGFIRREALRLLVAATTERTAAILLDQYNGALERSLQSILSDLDVNQVDAAARKIQSLIDRLSIGLHLTAPWRVVLAGPPNVGKSSLLNALLGFRRSIVFDQPGTTRDVVAAMTALDGWPVELSDTAGLRGTGDELEMCGIQRAQARLAQADCQLLVFDRAAPWTDECLALVESHPRAIIVHNKTDLPASSLPVIRPDGFPVSALTGQGMETLAATIVDRLVPQSPEFETPLPFTAEIIGAIEVASKLLAMGKATVAAQSLQWLIL